MRRKLNVSERRACRVLGQPPRSTTQRYARRKGEKDRILKERMLVLSRENPRYGYRRVWALLRREGWMVNKKRLYRLWGGKKASKCPTNSVRGGACGATARTAARGGEPHAPKPRLELRRLRDGPNRGRPQAEDDAHRRRIQQGVPEHRGRALDHRRGRGEHPGIPVPPKGRTCLHPLGQRPGVRCQGHLKRWLGASGVGTLDIEPGSPWENAYYSETFISRFGDELLKRELFADLLEAKVLVEDYRRHYNHHRPHSALGYRTPAEFASAADLDGKVENTRKPKELESVLILS